MELERLNAPIVPASLTMAALVKYCLAANLLSPISDGFDQVLTTVSVCTPLSHRSRIPTAGRSTN